MKVALAVFFLILLTTSGGKYQLQAPAPKSKVSIAVPFFVNETFKQGLSNILTQQVTEEFMRAGNFRITSTEQASFILKGKITHYVHREAISPGEYEVKIEVRAHLYSVEEGETIWERSLTRSIIYSTVGVGYIQTEQDAIQEVSRRLGESFLELSLDKWRK